MIKTITLLPGVTLQCFPDHRFKRGFLSLHLIRPMSREENAMNALLPSVLLRGTKAYPDLRAITLRLDDLYGAAAGTLVRRVGDYHTTGFQFSFIDNRFAMPGDLVLEPLLDFACQLLLEPSLEEGAFCRDSVESEKRNLIAAIESMYNNKRQYAAMQLLRLMCREDSTGIPRLGSAEQISAITPAALYAHYRAILRTSPIALFYVGSADPDLVAHKLKQHLKQLDRDPMILPAQTGFRDAGPQEQTEIMDVTQARLGMGFVTPITLHDPRYTAMKVCSSVLGGSMISKLFMAIREKLSLCYDIDADYSGTKGLLTVSAGINSEDFDLVRQQVLAQLEDCKANRISATELEAAKQQLISGLERVHDSGNAIESYYSFSALAGLNKTPAESMEAISAVTAEQVAAAAQTLSLHTVYFLKGVQ